MDNVKELFHLPVQPGHLSDENGLDLIGLDGCQKGLVGQTWFFS